jgi:heme/copper-type cytochrome/quinol oxidase subunit 1
LRLSALGLIAVVATFVAGIVPGLIAQAELAAPGIQIVPTEDPGVYSVMTTLHGASWALALPLAAIALALAQVSEARQQPILRFIAMLALAACPIVFAVMTFTGLNRSWALYDGLRNGLPIVATMLMFANVTLAFAQPHTRTAVIILTALSALAAGFGGMILLLLSNVPDSILHDTYVALAADHGFGVSVILGSLAGVSAWIGQSRGIRTILVSLVSGLMIGVTGYIAATNTSAAGMMGMPRRYEDYPTALAEWIGPASLWSFALAAAIAGFGWPLLNLRRKSAPGPEEVFD